VNPRRSSAQQVAEPRTPLRGHRLSIARVVWFAVTVLAIAIFVASVPAAYTQFHEVCPNSGCSGDWRLEAEDVTALEDLGLSLGFYAAYNTTLNVVYTLGFLAVGTFIFLKKPNDWMAVFTSLTLISYGTNYPIELAKTYPAWSLPVAFISYLGGASFFIFFYLFPNGRFVPRWTRALAAIWIVYQVPVYFFPASPFSGNTWPPLLKTSLWLAFLSTLVVAQVYRYVRVSGPIERDQAKWMVSGLTAVVAVVVGFSVVIVPFPTLVEPGVPGVLYTLVSRTVYYLALLLVPLSIAIAILRYRLWDMDVLINRTLVYGSLTVTLALVYFGGVATTEAIFRALTGQEQQPQVAVIVSTLVIAALFTPLRRRIQGFIDRRFYRRKYDARKTLEAFSAQLREETDLDALSDDLVGVVRETMQPAHVSLWLRPDRGPRKHGVVREPPG
jgi:hypothetical protein